MVRPPPPPLLPKKKKPPLLPKPVPPLPLKPPPPPKPWPPPPPRANAAVGEDSTDTPANARTNATGVTSRRARTRGTDGECIAGPSRPSWTLPRQQNVQHFVLNSRSGVHRPSTDQVLEVRPRGDNGVTARRVECGVWQCGRPKPSPQTLWSAAIRSLGLASYRRVTASTRGLQLGVRRAALGRLRLGLCAARSRDTHGVHASDRDGRARSRRSGFRVDGDWRNDFRRSTSLRRRSRHQTRSDRS